MKKLFSKVATGFKDFLSPITEGWICPKCGNKNFYTDKCNICGYELKP